MSSNKLREIFDRGVCWTAAGLSLLIGAILIGRAPSNLSLSARATLSTLASIGATGAAVYAITQLVEVAFIHQVKNSVRRDLEDVRDQGRPFLASLLDNSQPGIFN